MGQCPHPHKVLLYVVSSLRSLLLLLLLYCYARMADAAQCRARHQKRSGTQPCAGGTVAIVKVVPAALRPLIKLRDVDQDLAVGGDLEVSAIHGTGCGTFEVDALAVVAAAVAGTLELVFARLPIRGAAQLSAAGVNDKDAIWG